MKKIVVLCLIAILVFVAVDPCGVSAAGLTEISTGETKMVYYATDLFQNWDLVPSVAQFTDENGQFCFAYVDDNGKINVFKTEEGKVVKKLQLELKDDHFGTMVCDKKGNMYVISGTYNPGEDTSMETVFVSKYSSSGKLIKTVGDNGRSSLASYYGEDYNTKSPFASGTVDAAINGDYLGIYYARKMYNGHQSCSAWLINTKTMETVEGYINYESHSFGQRIVPLGDGFAFMSEGDGYDRVFKFFTVDLVEKTMYEAPVFDFWVEEGTFTRYDMHALNNNFAHIGNICTLKNGNISFVASSVKALSEKALKQKEQIFIQIFDPDKDVTTKEAYVTKGIRSGIAGKDGDEEKTNYGVKWLTNYKTGKVLSPQAVTDGKGNTIVLFERYNKKEKYDGINMIVVNSKGKVTQKVKKISKTAHLNPCETPVYYDGAIYWCANKEGDFDDNLIVYKYEME